MTGRLPVHPLLEILAGGYVAAMLGSDAAFRHSGHMAVPRRSANDDRPPRGESLLQRVAGALRDHGAPSATAAKPGAPDRPSPAEGDHAPRSRWRRKSPRAGDAPVARPGGHSARAAIAVGIAVAAMLPAAPLSVAIGARLLKARVDAGNAVLRREAAPRIAAQDAHAVARAELATVLSRPGIGVTLERLAAVLPAEAGVAGAGRDATGLLRLEIRTPDPDRLRAAIRRDPTLRQLREGGQARDPGGAIRVIWQTP